MYKNEKLIYKKVNLQNHSKRGYIRPYRTQGTSTVKYNRRVKADKDKPLSFILFFNSLCFKEFLANSNPLL
jgi:hypothetical protein